jgi:hypothetical protein
VRDSSGIQIVESNRASWRSGEGWTLAELPSLSIGTAGGSRDYILNRIVGATRLSDGRIAVATGDPAELRFYDSSGTFIRRAGRPGIGPGEFGGLNRFFSYTGDTLFVQDNRNAFIIFDSGGTLARHQRLGTRYFQVLDLLGTFADGRVVARIYHGEGPEADTAAARHLREYRVLNQDGTTSTSYKFAIENRPSWQFSRGATHLAVIGGAGPQATLERYHVLQPFYVQAVSPRNFFFADGARFEIEVYTPAGSLARIMRVTIPPERIPEEVKKDTVTVVIGRARYKPLETIWPEVYPAFGRLLADRAGNLWATKMPRAGASPDTTRYYAFDARGVLQGEVPLLSRMQIHEIGDDYVLGVELDTIGVEYVKLYKLRKPPR